MHLPALIHGNCALVLFGFCLGREFGRVFVVFQSWRDSCTALK